MNRDLCCVLNPYLECTECNVLVCESDYVVGKGWQTWVTHWSVPSGSEKVVYECPTTNRKVVGDSENGYLRFTLWNSK